MSLYDIHGYMIHTKESILYLHHQLTEVLKGLKKETKWVMVLKIVHNYINHKHSWLQI